MENMAINGKVNLKHFDATVFEGFSDADKDRHIDALVWGAYGVFADNGRLTDVADLAFDSNTIKAIEQFLDDRHMHRVLKWGDEHDPLSIKRVVTAHGVPSSNPKQIEKYDTFINCVAMLYGYCAAKETNGKIIVDADGGWWVKPANSSIPNFNPFRKVWKFLRNGAEDGLVSFLASVKARATQQPLIDEITAKLKASWLADGNTLPADAFTQVWTRADDPEVIEKIVLLTADHKPLCEILVVPAGEEMLSPADIDNTPDSAILRMVKSDEGQQILKHIWTEADVNGMCTRCNALDDAGQIDAFRGFLHMHAASDPIAIDAKLDMRTGRLVGGAV